LVRWRGIVRTIIPALTLFSPIIIAVIYVGYLHISGYGVTTDSLLAIVILFQTYIIWIQVEIALRQTTVFEAEYEPIFKVKTNTYFAPDRMTDAHEIISLDNVGEYPAYNVFIGLVDKTAGKPINKRMKPHSQAPITLTTEESFDVMLLIPESEYDGMNIEMNVLYTNVLNELREVTFVKLPKTKDFILLRAPLSIRRGILLKSLEDLKLAYRAIRYFR